MKNCIDCKQEKSLIDFHPPYGKGYISSFCKLCANLRSIKYGKTPTGRIKKLIISKSQQSKLRQRILIKLGSQCIICGFSDIRALQIDHIEGGGTELNKQQNWSTRYRSILNDTYTVKVQLLCANCNWIKRYENKELERRNVK